MKTEQKEVKMELKGETEVVFTRFFAAPRELVFDCHTKPELMRRWLTGPEGMVLETCEQDLKSGGKYLYLYGDQKEINQGFMVHFAKSQSRKNFQTLRTILWILRFLIKMHRKIPLLRLSRVLLRLRGIRHCLLTFANMRLLMCVSL
jgi:hypothetical protein